MAVVNLNLNQLSLFNDQINYINLLLGDGDGDGDAPHPLVLAPTLNTVDQELALNVLNNTPGEEVIVEATSNAAYWRTSRFFYIRCGNYTYYFSTDQNITRVYSVERWLH